jgi:predicted RND superfamily exporter protein
MIASVLRWARAHRRLVLSASALAALFSIVQLRSLTFDADVLHLLPRGGIAVPAFRTFLERFGTLDHLYVVFEAPAEHTIDEYDETIDAFVERLRVSPEIEGVDAGPGERTREWSYVADRILLLLGPRKLTQALSRFEPTGLPAQLASTRELLSVPSSEMASLVQSDPLGLFLLVRDRLAGATAGLAIDTSRGTYVTADGRSRLILVRPTRPPFDTAFSKQLFERVRGIEGSLLRSRSPEGESRTLAPLHPPGLAVRYAGGHRISLEIEGIVRRESIWNSVGALAVILPLLYFAFRSPWLVAVGAVPSALAILIVLAGYALTGSTLSAAATGAAAMQFGLGIDGVVLLFVAFRHLTSTGLDGDGATAGLAGSASSMLLGMWTTAATFYGLTVVDFPSLEELGRIIGHSMVLCGVLTLVLVPALLPRLPRRAPPLTAWWLSRLVERYAVTILVLAALVTIGFGVVATRLRVDPSLDRLRANTSGTAFEQEVATRFRVPQDVYVVTATGPSLEPLLEANESLRERLARAAPGVVVQTPASLLPSARAQAHAAATVRAKNLTPHIVSARLQQAAADAGFKPGTFDPFVERLPRLLDATERLTYDGFVSHGLGDLLARSITRVRNEWTLATYVYPRTAADVDAVRRVVRDFAGAMTLTGVPEVNRELGERFGPEFAKGVTVGTLLVVALLFITFRRIGSTILALVPTAVALVWAAGLLALARVELDLFSMFAVMTFVGIGVDYGIHMVHRFLHAPPESAGEVVAHLAPVILVAGATTLLGFGTLVTSSYPPLRSLGLVSIVMVVTLAVSSLLVLPALLVRGART